MTSLTSASVQYRSLQEGDQEPVLRLMRACGYSPDDRSWQWMNRLCPQGETLVELALAEDGEVIGHYGVWPRILHCGGVTLRAGTAIHAAIHPDHRGLAVLHSLMQRIVLRCRREGIPFLYGFPNDQVWLVYLKFFGWQPMGDLTALELPLNRWREPKAEGEPALRWVLRDPPLFDVEHGQIHQAMIREGVLRDRVSAVKDQAWLDWRYVRRPKVRYQMLEARSPAGELLGYLVLKRHEKSGVRYGHLIDFAIRPSQEQVFPAMVRSALRFFWEQRLDVASCWLPEATPMAQDLAGLGFQPTGFVTHMGVLRIEAQGAGSTFVSNRWHVIMGDSDAF